MEWDFSGFEHMTVGEVQRCFIHNLIEKRLVFVEGGKQVYKYNGVVWEHDSTFDSELATAFITDLLNHAKEQSIRDFDGKRVRDDLYRLAKRADNGAFVANACNKILKESGLKKDHNDLNSNPYLLTTPTEVIDLQTGKYREHRKSDYSTIVTNRGLKDEDSHPEKWDSFIDTVTKGDRDLARYLRDLCGTALIGVAPWKKFVIWYGKTGYEGKSTLISAISKVLGKGYLGTIRSDLFTNVNDLYASKIDAQLYEVRHARLVTGGELKKGAALNAVVVKRMSSGGTDEITAEAKYRQPLTFVPKFLTILHVNDLPRIENNGDDALMRRLRVVPFENPISKDDIIPNYDDVLANEAGTAILKWLIEGARNVLKNGDIEDCEAVLRASLRYTGQQETLREFLQTCYRYEPTAKATTTAIFKSYTQFCQTRGYAVAESANSLKTKILYGNSELQLFGDNNNGGNRLYICGFKLLPMN